VVTEGDVRHVAELARLGLDPARIGALVRELNGILAHMEALAGAGEGTMDAGPGGAGPLRADAGPQLPLAVPRESFAPEMRDGFFLVPRLATHDDGDRSP